MIVIIMYVIIRFAYEITSGVFLTAFYQQIILPFFHSTVSLLD